MSSPGTGTRRRRAGLPPPERRRRGDLVAAAVIVTMIATVAVVLARTSDVAGARSAPATVPVAAPPEAVGVPAGLVEAWRAPSGGTPEPVVAGPAVVTAEGGAVVGRDALTGAQRWSYSRDLPLCTVGAAFPAVQTGRVLALYGTGAGGGDGEYCSELTMLDARTGERVSARNPDARPGTRLVADDTYVMATGTDHLDVLRSDLVRTLEYGAVPAQEQADRQPRPDCRYGSAALGSGRVAVVERCPGEDVDRLTVLAADGADGSEQPDEEFSVLLPGPAAVVVAVSAERVAVAVGGELVVLDRTGARVSATAADIAPGDPPGGVAPTSADGELRYWWTGTTTVALDPAQLTPVWTLPGTLGPAVAHGGGLLVPVPDGLLQVDPRDGTPVRLLPVQRSDRGAPVTVAAHGEVLLELRGTELVALRPAP